MSFFPPRYKLSLNNHNHDNHSWCQSFHCGANSISIIITTTIIHTSLFTPRYKLSLNNHNCDDHPLSHCLHHGTNSALITVDGTPGFTSSLKIIFIYTVLQQKHVRCSFLLNTTQKFFQGSNTLALGFLWVRWRCHSLIQLTQQEQVRSSFSLNNTKQKSDQE